MQHACEIHEDLVFEILTRLPGKSLMRFKCVSKKWSSIISSRYFGNRYLRVTRQQPHHLYMCLVNEEDANQSVLPSASLDSNCLVIDQDLSVPGIGGFNLNVVRGLMCFSVSEKASVYNPTTRQLLTLPAIKSDILAEQDQRMFTGYYIGHDPANDQYKLLCTTVTYSHMYKNIKSEHWLLLLEEQGGSWKKVVVPLEDYLSHVPSRQRWLSINGSVVHYMAWTDYFTCAVVSFDIRSEELTTILVPQEVLHLSMPAAIIKAGLVEYGGKIAIFDDTYLKVKGLMNLWTIEDVGKKEWSKKTLVLQPCQRHLVHETRLVVNGTTHDGKVIMAPWKTRSQFYILIYDMKLNDLRKVEINGVPDSFSLDKKCYVHYK